jgi:hypothetical protein
MNNSTSLEDHSVCTWSEGCDGSTFRSVFLIENPKQSEQMKSIVPAIECNSRVESLDFIPRDGHRRSISRWRQDGNRPINSYVQICGSIFNVHNGAAYVRTELSFLNIPRNCPIRPKVMVFVIFVDPEKIHTVLLHQTITKWNRSQNNMILERAL